MQANASKCKQMQADTSKHKQMQANASECKQIHADTVKSKQMQLEIQYKKQVCIKDESMASCTQKQYI